MYSIKNSVVVVSHEIRRSFDRTHTAACCHRLGAPKSRRFCRTKILPVARPAGSDSSETSPSRLEDKRGPEEVTYRLDSFERTVEDACTSLLMALDAGEKRVEVEFPPLPASISGTLYSSRPSITSAQGTREPQTISSRPTYNTL